MYCVSVGAECLVKQGRRWEGARARSRWDVRSASCLSTAPFAKRLLWARPCLALRVNAGSPAASGGTGNTGPRSQESFSPGSSTDVPSTKRVPHQLCTRPWGAELNRHGGVEMLWKVTPHAYKLGVSAAALCGREGGGCCTDLGIPSIAQRASQGTVGWHMCQTSEEIPPAAVAEVAGLIHALKASNKGVRCTLTSTGFPDF